MNLEKENLIPASPAGGPTEESKKSMSSKKWLIILIVILAVIIITAVILVVVLREEKVEEIIEQEETQQETELPVRNGTMSLQTEEESVGVGEVFQVNIVMDTQDSNIVVASADVIYESTVLELVSVESQSSVLNMSILEDKKNGEIKIIRGAPGDANYDDNDDGYVGDNGVLASLKFKVLKTSLTEIGFNIGESNMFLDDGQATEMNVEYNNLILNIK